MIDKEELKQIISDDIDMKLHVFTISNQLDYSKPSIVRDQIAKLVEKVVESWGFIPQNVSIIGPNEDKEIYIQYNIAIPSDGKNAITGVQI
jgi:hypothetical protein